jgi:hypothetical protein
MNSNKWVPITVAAATLTVAWLLFDGATSRSTAESHRAVGPRSTTRPSSARPSQTTAHAPPTFVRVGSTASSSAPSLSDRGQRANEPDWLYPNRLTGLEMWRRFTERAELTPRQDEQMRIIFGDAQLNHVELIKAAISTDYDDRNASSVLQDRERELDDEVRQRAREVLTDEQFALFRRWIPRPYMLVATEPFELQGVDGAAPNSHWPD